jgi:hypothetical protein
MRRRIFVIELELCASHYVFLAPLDIFESSPDIFESSPDIFEPSPDIFEPTDGKHSSNSEFVVLLCKQ